MTTEIWVALALCLNIGYVTPDGKGNILGSPDCQLIASAADKEHSIDHAVFDNPGERDENLAYIENVARRLRQKGAW